MNSPARPQVNGENVHAPLVSSTRPHVVREITEAKMNELIRSLGLEGWQIVWEPDSGQTKRGRIVPEARIILVHDPEVEAAMRTVLHEVLELKLRPAFNMQTSLTNALLEWANTEVYKAKERAIEDLIPFLLKSIEEGYPSERKLEEVLDS